MISLENKGVMEDGRDSGCIDRAQTGENIPLETVFEAVRKLSEPWSSDVNNYTPCCEKKE